MCPLPRVACWPCAVSMLQWIKVALAELCVEPGSHQALYAITYTLFTGTVVHRAKSAADAIETMQMLRRGGGQVIKLVENRTGKEITVPELQLLARRESSAVERDDRASYPWFRRTKH